MAKHKEKGTLGQASVHQAEALSQLCYVFVRPVLCRLQRGMDRRLVQTLLDLLQVIVMHRHRQQGLVLSELGSYLLGPAQAPAGTKRIEKAPAASAAPTKYAPIWNSDFERKPRILPVSSSASSP